METGMTRDKYLELCEQLNKEPKEKEMPPEIGDFPIEVQKAILIFNKLGDRVYPDIGYLGKDYVSLPIHMEILGIEDKEIFLETLLRLDSKVIKKSQDMLKTERDKITRANKKL